MRFTKMHGCGNDYVYVNCFEETVADPAALARRVSDRHFGIGSDGLILICPSDTADVQMRMFNADGSEGAMCGNGIRCVGKYAYDFGLVDEEQITVSTKSGIKTLDLYVEDGKVARVRVDMGAPIFAPREIPVDVEALTSLREACCKDPEIERFMLEAPAKDALIHAPIIVDGRKEHFTAVSMGNPHAVVFMDGVADLAIEEVGPKYEMHPAFPDRVNTEFIEVIDDHTIRMRVWERGSGETLACGTGACAAAVAAILNEKVKEDPVTVQLLGGDLTIEWDHKEQNVRMTGPATTVFTGEIEV